MNGEHWAFIGGLLGSLIGSGVIALHHLRSQGERLLERRRLMAAEDCIRTSDDYIKALESALQSRDNDLFQKIMLRRPSGKPS